MQRNLFIHSSVDVSKIPANKKAEIKHMIKKGITLFECEMLSRELKLKMHNDIFCNVYLSPNREQTDFIDAMNI